MKTIYYTVDVQNLLFIQDKETAKNGIKKEREQEEFISRKNRLLKIALPFIHGIIVLHNNKCENRMDSTTGKEGLLGLSKIDLEKRIATYTDQDFRFSHCGGTVEVSLKGADKISIWLNDSLSSTFRATPHLGYSMTSTIIGQSYGDSIEDELIAIAKYCSKYTDSW